MAQPESSEQPTHKDGPNTRIKSEAKERERSTSSPSTSLVDSGSILDDFRKCIDGFDPADAAVLQMRAAQQHFSTEANAVTMATNANGHTGTHYGQTPKVLEYLKLKESSMKEEGRKFAGGASADEDDAAMFKDVKRYNIMNGTIMHCRELESQGGEGSQDGDEDSEDKLYDEEDGSMSSPSQHMEEETEENFFPCKVCKQRYISKSSLRKHICRGIGEADQAPVGAEPKREEVVQVPQPLPIPLQIPIPIPVDLRRDTPSNDSEVLDMRYRVPVPVTQTLENGHTIISPVTGSLMPSNGPEFYTLTGEALMINENGNLVPEIHACPICNMTFQHASQLMRHRRTHSNERPFECAECHQAFRRKCHLKRHWQRIHSGEKPFKCGICGKAFSDRDHQRQHETIHGPETYPCLKCRSVFPTEAYLVSHVAEHPDCKAAFAKGEDGSPKRVRGKRKGTPGSYRCGLCGDFFKKLRQIQTHQRVRHHDVFEKKYKCNICGKGFDLISDLTHHRHTHAARGSKYDVDKESERPTMLKQMLTNAAEKNVQNKQELMGMLQLLERRIQHQQKQVRKIEGQQDRMSNELIDGTATISGNNNISIAESIFNNSKLRTLLERKPLSELTVLKREHDAQQGGPDPKMMRSNNNRMVLDLSNPKVPKTPTSLAAQPRPSNPDKSEVTFIGEQAPEEANLLQSPAIMDLMTGNRHKCEECGLSFLLYSDFRTHRKRHERARLAMGKEDAVAGTTTDMVCGNPDGDRSLCRDCCNQNDSSGSKPSMTVHHHKHDEESGRHLGKPGCQQWNGKHNAVSKHCERKSVEEQTCMQCTSLRDQLTKEREEKGVLKVEVDRLREALVNFAKMASTHPTLGANIGQELTALFSRSVTIKQEVMQPEFV